MTKDVITKKHPLTGDTWIIDKRTGETIQIIPEDNLPDDPQMIDITAPQHVEVQIRGDGKVIWINIDGICRLRACQIKTLTYSSIPKQKPK